jgi:hypothetical protein
MPTYDENEQSVQDSAPIECYKFVGAFKNYLYTSSDQQEVVGGETYFPIAVTRSKVQGGTQDQSTLSLDLQIPFDVDVVTDYAFSNVPPSLELTVYRKQPDDTFAIFWTGQVLGFEVADRLGTVKVPSIFALALSGECPSVHYQVPCNHLLYGPHCQVSRVANTFTDHVQAIVDGTDISLVGIPTTANDLRGGEIINTRNGERRLILLNAGSLITIGYAFADLQVGDPVSMVRGCDHMGRTGDCKNKFNNYINFGGFEDIPPDNPFSGSLV